METYSYYKALTRVPSSKEQILRGTYKRFFRILPNILIVIGATAVTTVLYPMLSYQIMATQWDWQKVASPLPKNEWEDIKQLAGNKANPHDPAQSAIAYQEPAGPEVITDIDYTKADTWFTKPILVHPISHQDDKNISYTLSIPKLNIENMTVVYGANDLDKQLIHYAGTALPGEYGNPVIFGHSVLPIFNNPKSYRSIFSRLPTLAKGDKIIVDYDGVTYTYEVESYHEVKPDQVDVLEQRYDRQTITLVTCVPPGTTLRRGVIQAVLTQ